MCLWSDDNSNFQELKLANNILSKTAYIGDPNKILPSEHAFFQDKTYIYLQSS